MDDPTDLIAPSALAKSLGIRMQSIYSRIRSGQLAGYGSNPVMVSESAARQVMSASAKSSGSRRGVARGPRKAKARVQEGDFIATAHKKAGVNVRQVKRVFLADEDEDGNEAGEPTLIQASGGAYFEPGLLKAQLDQGLSCLVSVGQVIGLVLTTLVEQDNLDAAASLEVWAGAHNIEVVLED